MEARRARKTAKAAKVSQAALRVAIAPLFLKSCPMARLFKSAARMIRNSLAVQVHQVGPVPALVLTLKTQMPLQKKATLDRSQAARRPTMARKGSLRWKSKKRQMIT